MARSRRRNSRVEPRKQPAELLATPIPPRSEPVSTGRETVDPDRSSLSRRLGLFLAAALLAIHWALAVDSLTRENMTVDEVIHLPAGLTYWQTGTFKLYPHNPPLIKMIAALPLIGDEPLPPALFEGLGWKRTNKAVFAHEFAFLNSGRYFELFDKARLVMPSFSVLGGVVIFLWSSRLHGRLGGLISLTLWCFCPNILAHTRLITTDVGATVLGFCATYLFWRYCDRPSWGRAIAAGLVLGLAQLAKFSMLLLYGLWPILWFTSDVLRHGRAGLPRRIGPAFVHGLAVVAISVLVINVGYGFEGFGQPLGSYRFTCRILTQDRASPIRTEYPPEDLGQRVQQLRENRFSGTLLASVPVPLPRYYVTGFDDQKLEAEGVPAKVLASPEQLAASGTDPDKVVGYPVFLDGDLRKESWWYYYWFTLFYKVPETTWALVLGSLVVLVRRTRSGRGWADELTLAVVPLTVLVVMSFATNIALGLRYILPITPYVFTGVGKLGAWAEHLSGARRRIAFAAIGIGLAGTMASAAWIHPHYLAYFNIASGGPENGSEHLIDSNLDWGQDLVNLRDWLETNAPGERVGVAYFGQVHPDLFRLRGQPLDWYLPPVLPGTLPDRPGQDSEPPGPGLYAVSASLVRGLPWRVYMPTQPVAEGFRDPRVAFGGLRNWMGISAAEQAFGYFRALEPIGHVGFSILIYRITEQDLPKLARFWSREGRP